MDIVHTSVDGGVTSPVDSPAMPWRTPRPPGGCGHRSRLRRGQPCRRPRGRCRHGWKGTDAWRIWGIMGGGLLMSEGYRCIEKLGGQGETNSQRIQMRCKQGADWQGMEGNGHQEGGAQPKVRFLRSGGDEQGGKAQTRQVTGIRRDRHSFEDLGETSKAGKREFGQAYRNCFDLPTALFLTSSSPTGPASGWPPWSWARTPSRPPCPRPVRRRSSVCHTSQHQAG